MDEKLAREILDQKHPDPDFNNLCNEAKGFLEGLASRDALIKELEESFKKCERLWYGLQLDLKQSSLAQKVIDELRRSITKAKEVIKP